METSLLHYLLPDSPLSLHRQAAQRTCRHNIGPSRSRCTMADTLDVRPTILYDSRLLTCGPCQGHLFSADAGHDLCLPDWDSSTALLPRRQTCKEWFPSANFQRPTDRVDCPLGVCESETCARWRRLSGVQAKLFLVTSPCDVCGVVF